MFILGDDPFFSGDGMALSEEAGISAVNPTALHLYYRLGTAIVQGDKELGYPLLFFLHAATVGLWHVDQIIRDSDEGSGWGPALDVDRVPYFRLMRYLAQFIGVETISGQETLDANRAKLRYPASHFGRGTREHMVQAAKAYLTGGKFVRLTERTISPYHLEVLVARRECPDPGAVRNAVLSQKPAGLVADFILSDFNTYGDQKQAFATYTILRDAFVTYRDSEAWSFEGFGDEA